MSMPSLMSLLKRRDLSGVVYDTISYLASQPSKKVLFITTSTRYPFNTEYNKGGVELELPKSTELSLFIQKEIPNKSEWIDIPQLKIYPCEGNVSHKTGNTCGVMDAVLNDKKKNPTGNRRCWASIDGQAGNDYISGGEGSDQINGNDGDDKIFGDIGNDFINGGSGNDMIRVLS